MTNRTGTILSSHAGSDATPSVYVPSSMRSACDITITGSSSTIIAIVDADGYPNAECDLGVYRAQCGLPTCTTANGCFVKYNQNDAKRGYPSQNVGWSQENALDLGVASVMCPNCKIILVEATSATDANLVTAVNAVASLVTHVISNSVWQQ